jgi:hypothetical protein
MWQYFQVSRVGVVIIAAMLVLVLLCTVPVFAADIDITIEGPGISNWAFVPETTNIDSTNITLNVTSISSTWTVSVKDDLDFGKPPGTVGRMAESDAGGVYTGTNVFRTAMTITGPNMPLNTTGASIVLSGSNQVIESGLKPVTGLRMPLTISQLVTIRDPALKEGHRYQVIVTFIAFAEGGPAPVVTGIVPAEGITGTTVTVTDLSGSNFLPHSTAVLNMTGTPDINLTVIGVTSNNRMTGIFNLAGAGVGLWDVTVTNPDGRTGTKPRLFWIKYPAKPGVSGFAPISGTRGKTINIGVTGNYFQNGVAVNLTYGTSVITAVVSSVTPTRINGVITIPPNAPTGDWDLVVTNNDGQFDGMLGALTVE